MRILLLAQFYPPVIGGEERHVRNLAVALAARGHDVHVATLATDHGDPIEDAGVTVHRLDSVGRRVPALYPTADRPLALPVPDPVTVGSLRAVLDAVDPDVVHAHNWLLASYLPLAAARRRPLVYSLHDYSHVCPTKRYMHEGTPCSGPAPLKCLRCASDHYGPARGGLIATSVRAGVPARRSAVDVFTPVSAYVGRANRLDRTGDRWQVVPNFVPDALTTPVERPRDPDLPDRPYLFFAGDLSAQKGVSTLLAAWTRWVGDPAGRPDLVLVGRPAMDLADVPAGVHVHHHWEHERVLSGFAHALAAVLPSEWPDPCPTTVLEAMALGVPLVTTTQGGIADMVVAGESALTTAPGDVEGLARALHRMSTEPDLRTRLAARGSVEVQRFLQSRVAADFEGIYESLAVER